jgi:hypothetical protein
MLPNEFGLFGTPAWNQSWIGRSYETAIVNITTIRTGSILDQQPEDYHNWTSIAFPNNGSKLLHVFGIGPTPGTIPREPDVNDTKADLAQFYAPPVAYECLLQFCVRNMNATFVNGTLHETEISTFVDQNQVTGKRPGPNDTAPPYTLQPPGAPSDFIVEDLALGTTSRWLSDILRGSATHRDGSLFNIQSSPPRVSSDIVQSVYLAMNKSRTGFPDLMDKLAQSLSLSLRDIPYQSKAPGTSFSVGNHAVVRWPWLILPGVELVVSLVFLVIVMLETRKAGLMPWTNNPLAYFFHGFDERPLCGNDFKTQSLMEREARGLMVQFRKHDEGGRLVVVDKVS